MLEFGPFAFWPALGATFGAIAIFALYRMTQSAALPADETEHYVSVLPTASPVVVEAVGALAAEHAEAEYAAEQREGAKQ